MPLTFIFFLAQSIWKFDRAVFLFFERVEGWVGAGPDAAWPPIQVASHPMAAAVGQDAWWLIGHYIGWIYELRLQSDLLVNVRAVLDFQCFPGFFGHLFAPVILVYPQQVERHRGRHFV